MSWKVGQLIECHKTWTGNAITLSVFDGQIYTIDKILDRPASPSVITIGYTFSYLKVDFFDYEMPTYFKAVVIPKLSLNSMSRKGTTCTCGSDTVGHPGHAYHCDLERSSAYG